MHIEKLTKSGTSFDFSPYTSVGYHATSSLACVEIEKIGFLPHKIFSPDEHNRILAIARRLALPVTDYLQWLGMRSVSFGKSLDRAAAHASSGRAGGQGLMNLERLLELIDERGNDADQSVGASFAAIIHQIRESASVIYAVDLSTLGPRLVDDGDYQFYWNPNAPLPAKSEIGPERLIAKFSL